jgi:hypothetical protein
MSLLEGKLGVIHIGKVGSGLVSTFIIFMPENNNN